MENETQDFAKNREKLTAALRSGDYIQAAGKYRHPFGGGVDKYGHCAIGVVIDLFAPEAWGVYDDDAGYFPEFPSLCFEKAYCALGFTTHGAGHLVELNDLGENSFAEIADEIDENPYDFFAKNTI